MSAVPLHCLLYLVLMAIPLARSGLIKMSDTGTVSATPLLPWKTINKRTEATSATEPPAAAATSLSHSTVTSVFSTFSTSSSIGSIIPSVTASTQTSIIITHSSSSTPLASPTQSQDGAAYGKVIIKNLCETDMYMWSVGAWPLGGARNNNSWNAIEDTYIHGIPSGKEHIEPYRITCPIGESGKPEYSAECDKLTGQGVSMKISNSTHMGLDILQLEYALIQNSASNSNYHTLNYDVSLLDCADPKVHPELYDNPSRTFTDQHISAEDLQKKIDSCPGYKKGLKVTFDPVTPYCRPIDCVEGTQCPVYYFERSYLNASSFVCTKEFRGNVVLTLCAGNV